MDDFLISFDVGGVDKAPPVVSGIKVISGSIAAVVIWETDEPSTSHVQYNLTPILNLQTPENPDLVTFHKAILTGLSPKTAYFYRIVSKDEHGNSTTIYPKLHIFGTTAADETTPPVLSQGGPQGALPSETSEVLMTLVTNEEAQCKYDLRVQMSYNEMRSYFSDSGLTFHSTEVGGLEGGKTFNYYVGCKDLYGNVSQEEFVITFSIEVPSFEEQISSLAKTPEVSEPVSVSVPAPTPQEQIEAIQIQVEAIQEQITLLLGPS